MDPLANLHDIHHPAEIGFWPLAWGWWLVILVTLVLIFYSIVLLRNYYRVRKIRRLALIELKNIDISDNRAINQLNQLLKRVCKHYYSSFNIQQLYGEKWSQFLVTALPEKLQKQHKATLEMMQSELYNQLTPEQSHIEQYISLVEVWLKQATPPKPKALKKLEQDYA